MRTTVRFSSSSYADQSPVRQGLAETALSVHDLRCVTLVKKLPVHGQPAPTEPALRADAARNHTRILAAARKLLGKRPIREICMDELARAAGVGKGTLYRRFVDRSSLCRALLDESERALQERVLRGFDLPSGAKAKERVMVLLSALFDFTLENAALLAEAEAYQRGVDARFTAPPYAWRRRVLLRTVERARADGDASPGDAGLTTDLLLGCMSPEQLLYQQRDGRSDESLRVAYADTWRRLLGLANGASG